MKITDPGPQYEYLVVETARETLQVLKRNRATRFDAFWATELVMEEEKPDLRLTYSEIPVELWEIFSEEEERLTAALASAERENGRLAKRASKSEQYLVVALLVILGFVSAYLYSRFR